MSLEKWLSTGKKVSVGGRELIMMPLPLRKLHGLGVWLETTTREQFLSRLKEPDALQDPFIVLKEILVKVDLSDLCMEIFSTKDPAGKLINEGISEEFFDEYLDAPTVKNLVKAFVEVNEIEEIIKNLSSLPIVKGMVEAMSLTFGLPFLKSLLPSTDSAQTQSEGSLSRRSTDTSRPDGKDTQENPSQPAQVRTEPPTTMVQ